ncbi:MAG: protein kinase [Planctomycetes bacterium]|nr:protein kinase [Planctomycetota bacterium]
MAGADLTFNPAAHRPPADGGEGGDEDLYDLAENGEGLDDFLSGAKVGRGPVGTSYTGRRKSDGALVVVKVLSRRFAQHPDLLAQVLDDVGAWQGVHHPRLAGALATGVSNERQVIIYEEAPGGPLSDRAGPARLEPRAALRVVYDVAQGLVAGLERGLPHGDVRPGKVFYDGQHAVLVDPGLARASCLAAGYGQHGLSFGHPTYLAPEVLQEHLDRPTPATDVYALGVLFYELVCGVPPFQGEVVEVLGKHFDAPLPPPPQGVTFSAAIAGLMLRMTAKSPSQRLPDARAVVTAITNLLEGKPIGPVGGQAAAARQARSPAAAISADDWGRASQREDHKGISNQAWTVSKIEQAPAVGPTDLGEPLTSDISGSGARSASTTGRLPREVMDEVALLTQAPGAARVGEKLGRGPVGTTYEGALPNNPAPVVVKVLSKKFSKHPDLLRRILEGVRDAAGFNHPGVVRPLKAVQVGGRDMVVFERAAGGRTLREALGRGPLPWRQATALVLGLARTLEAAARHGLSHGDVRPEKVFVDDAGRPRLADLGLAEAACLGAGFGAAGMSFGHPAYLAPEVVQERRRAPDERSDVYALGIVYYELLCGRPPFQGGEPKRLLVQHLEAALPPPPDGVTVPGAVAELILRMTAKDPARRVASMAELVRRLEQTEGAASQDGVPSLPSGEGDLGRSSGALPSGVGPLDFDPSEDEMVSPDAWGEQSLDLSRPSGEWAKEKIAEAPKVGPEEWTPEQSDIDEQSEPAPRPVKGGAPAASPPAAAKDALSAAIAAAAVTRPSEPEGPSAADSSRTTKKRQAGAAAAPPRGGKPAAAGEGNKKQLLVAVGGIALTLVVMLVLVLRSGDQRQTGEGNGQVTEAPPPPVQPPGPDPLKERQALRARLERALREAETDVEDLARSQRLREAAERLKRVPDEVRSEPDLATRLDGLEGRIRQVASERFAREEGEIAALVNRREFARAQSVANGVAQWAPDPAMAQRARQALEERLRAYDQPVAELELDEAFDGQALEAQLGAAVRGWSDGGRLFSKGGVAVVWNDPAVLFEDVQVLQGKAAVDALPDGRSALRVTGTEAAPALVVLKLPLKRLVDATLDMVLAAEPARGAHAALVMGVRPPAQVRGFGTWWGTAPVELVSLQERLRLRATVPRPALPLDAPLSMRLRMSGDRQLSYQGALAVNGAVKEGSAASVDAGRSAGRLALWVEGAELWLTGLEVRGLPDPAGLR